MDYDWIKKEDYILFSEIAVLSTSESWFKYFGVIFYLSSLGFKLSVFRLCDYLPTLFGVLKHLDIPRAYPLDKALH